MSLPQDIIWKLVLAIVVGGAIGAEREYRSKSAGFRTLTLICLGATLFTILSRLIGSPGSPDRIASNVVVGIGFVGAGVIFKGDSGSSKRHHHGGDDLGDGRIGHGHWRGI
jgi:putative Mg2+ transporter-C (MgtC) family protein